MKLATWMTTPNFQHAEIARDCGLRHVVLDIEHGTFDLGSLDRFIAFLNALGMGVHAKVLGPQTEAIQQALDFGADSVIIPHIGDAAHAEEVCAAAKYPPLGKRSFAGGRCMGFKRQTDDYFPAENNRVQCWPMCETASSLEDIEKILALPTVDGIFMGPSDLSLSRGRPNYHFTDEDRLDIARVADACHAAGKDWVMPGWRPDERAFAREQKRQPAMMVAGPQYGIIRAGFDQLISSLEKEGIVTAGP
ncbi:MAG: aldolase/citrate lyase family protein [Geminicoccaceae bacterium]